MPRLPDGWQSTLTRRDDEVDSEQWALSPQPVVAPTLEGARRLGHEYWRAVTRSTLGLVRVRESRDTRRAARCSGCARRSSRSSPRTSASSTIAWRAPSASSAGVLARRSGGTLTLTQVGLETAELRVAVKGFHPRLGLLFAPLEQRLHASVSRRYLAGGTR